MQCDGLPSKFGEFEKDDCADGEFVDYCTDDMEDGGVFCIRAYQPESYSGFGSGDGWSFEGMHIQHSDGQQTITEVELGGASYESFDESELEREMRALARSFSDPGMKEEVIDDVRNRR